MRFINKELQVCIHRLWHWYFLRWAGEGGYCEMLKAKATQTNSFGMNLATLGRTRIISLRKSSHHLSRINRLCSFKGNQDLWLFSKVAAIQSD